jgi:hypothetical protein
LRPLARIRLGERVISARHRIGTGLVAVAMLLVAGCTDLGDPAAAQDLSRNDLAAELAAQLAGSASLTYLATYQLAGGATATIAQGQRPLRTAYRYPGGAVLITTAATTLCQKQTCTMTAPTPTPAATVFVDGLKAGMITPAAVEDLLNAARIDPDVTVGQHDTTIAGRHATCVKLGNVDAVGDTGQSAPDEIERRNPQTSAAQTSAAQTSAAQTSAAQSSAAARTSPPAAVDDQSEAGPAGAFSTCITSDGLVGSFTGTLNGTKIDIALTDYADEVAGNAFDPPPSAKLIDHR